MLSRSRLYRKKDPDRDARLFIIFTEGEKTEPNYFRYFNGISSQIRIEVVPPESGKSFPGTLYEVARKVLVGVDGAGPKYDARQEDEVWFVIDTDQWGAAIGQLRTSVADHPGWAVAQSNPCFEVWLYYHFNAERPELPDMGVSKEWKRLLNEMHGGFNSNKHPIWLERAIGHAKANYVGERGSPGQGSTEMYLLAERMLPLVKDVLDAGIAVQV